jgi:hypothetical protein
MELKEVRKVVRYSNEESAGEGYVISADVVSVGGKFERIESGNVTKGGVLHANFNTSRETEGVTTVTYYNEAGADAEAQCVIVRLISDFAKQVKN